MKLSVWLMICTQHGMMLQAVDNVFAPVRNALTQFGAQLETQATSAAQAIAQTFEKGKDWVIQTGAETQSAVVTLFSTPA